MFGGLGGKNTIDHKRSVLALLNDDRLTPAQKSAYCYDQGVCDKCGVKTHWVGPFKRRPYTNERVWNGICRTCRAGECPDQDDTSNHNGGVLPVPNPAMAWGQLQKMAVPPDVLLAKTTTAFTKLQTGVTEGINTLNDNIKSQSEKMSNTNHKHRNSNGNGNTNGNGKHHPRLQQQQQGTARSSQKQQPRQNKKGGLNMNVFGPRRDNAPPPPPPQAPKTALCGLKTFETNEKNSKDEPLLLEDTSTTTTGTSVIGDEDLLHGDAVKGKMVKTPFGKGQVVDYRSEDDIYVIDLHHSLNGKSDDKTAQPSSNNTTKLFCKKESFSIEHENKTRQNQSMELNDAYESLEKMRRLNLELECQDRGVHCVDFDMCTMCLLNPGWEEQQQQQNPQNFKRIRKFVRDSQKKKAATPCLFCAAPTCVAHACPAFRKENITACNECVKLFEPDYVVDCINQAHGLALEKAAVEGHTGEPTRERPLDHMMDLYDRVLLLLQYSSQYIESIAAALEENTKKNNNINVGASSAGIVSGALGVCAAAAIFTPAGPPLLVASLLLGGGATTVQTGTEVVNYFSEPNKFADKIIALVGMLHSLLRVKENLREILTARLLEEEGNPEIDRLKNSLIKLREKQREAAFKAGTTVASTAVLGSVAVAEVAAAAGAVESAAFVGTMEVGTLAGRNANMFSRGGTAIARGARFARFAGGALSAATLVLEARTMSTTLEQIRAGHPCEKADALRGILKELPTLPTTEQLDDECRIYIGAMSNRVNATSLEDAINLIESKAIQEFQVTKAKAAESVGQERNEEMAPAGASILDGDDEGVGDEGHDEFSLLSSALKEAQEKRMTQSMSELPPSEVLVPSTGDLQIETDSASVQTAPARMAQSMTQLSPSTPGALQQSALLERIQKFKQEDSIASSSGGPTN